jgi:hypothetical protein
MNRSTQNLMIIVLNLRVIADVCAYAKRTTLAALCLKSACETVTKAVAAGPVKQHQSALCGVCLCVHQEL